MRFTVRKDGEDDTPHSTAVTSIEQMELWEKESRETQSHVLAEAIPNMVWTAHADGYIDYYNKRWEEYTGRKWEYFDVNGLKDVVHPEDYATCQQRWKNAIATGQTYEIEYRIKRASDGSYRWHLGRALPVQDGKGTILRWFGTCTDIDDQKRTENAMRDMNKRLEEHVHERTRELEEALVRNKINIERMRNILSSMNLGTVMTDENRLIILANTTFCRMFGLDGSPESLVGRKGMEVFGMIKEQLELPREYEVRLLQTAEGGKPSLDAEVLLKDGRILSQDYLPVIVEGQARGHLFLYRDVTRERRVDSAKSEFMSLASHQLRTPLTRIRWSLNRLEKVLAGLMPETAVSHLNTAKHAVVGMTDTIRTMLAISRLESKEIQLRRTTVELDPLLRDLAVEYAGDRAENMRIEIDCDPSLTLETDPHVLKEILSNLIGNAFKYTPDGGGVTLSAARENGRVTLRVRDTGLGIPAYQQTMVFSKFFRGDNVLQTDTDGNGLGLYLTSRLVHLLGGTIAFASEEGKGTTFTLELPMAIG